VFKRTLILTLLLSAVSWAQQTGPKVTPSPEGQTQTKLNILNVCRPSAEDQAEIKSVFAKVAAKPVFGRDFEISRGRTSVKDAPESKFVRLRRDMTSESPLMTTQYSMSTDATNTVELLVLRSRDAKDFHEIALEDRVSSGSASPLAILSVDTPVTRIRLERLGKRSIVLARCPDADQSAYEPLFRNAADLMARYRKAMGLRSAFRADIGWLSAEGATKPEGAKHRDLKK
jgi:hypothetical protein